MHWIDHHFLPDIGGTLERFIVNRDGDVDGLILMYEPDRYLLVHVPPHLGPQVTAAAAPGDAMRVRGLRPRGADMVAAVAVIASDGAVILDNGPDDAHAHRPRRSPRKAQKVQLDGVVRMSLFGPRGELRGALLGDGGIVRMDAKDARRIAALLGPGAMLSVQGDGLDTQHGCVVWADEIGPDRSHRRSAKEPAAAPPQSRDAREPQMARPPAAADPALGAA